MKSGLCASFFFIVFLLVPIGSVAQASKASLSDLGWLAGCWESSKERGSSISEQWMKPAGGMMIGMARTVTSGKAAHWEFMRIEQVGDNLTFFATPKGNAGETPFKLIRIGKDEVAFENPANDFPHRVIYRLVNPNELAARIEGTLNGKVKGIDFPSTRAKCD